MSSVAPDGRWNTIYAAATAFSKGPDLEKAWTNLVNVNIDISKDPTDPKEALIVSGEFGGTFRGQVAWEPPGLFHLKLEITKDGKTATHACRMDEGH
jgi:hypothetical protein